ncbi:FHF complex subunit HOOK interacting protein 1B [Rhincodon typus]|uniref:FHF complex subunit HOOK interacting protein 1B n=1 Tax=Rhincodon typus TaxID=259920 RepID=UPI00202E57AF|nr:FHF complex subunit HOOK interacting protein 1B [Rhincodon typus]XP_048454124.1 FHF complex subunit HOOK interacting protein 1B [Rhincodon typus]XP_048454125.1 FHF complex subunit HOOK interacting protein 1B [Rhincodon typus]XP_048454126.1 FHF complex subunit HOOK interacting protein 1B [Rhincodon typus]XP_048454127.1 FHF complex subunit HOOK interacting protein 1B [Rhincodon typus]XP_048454128.1 FHF complex subunit HOOK interacting protein 1B [Rhincodon typus]
MKRMSWLSKLNPRGAGNRVSRASSPRSPVTADPETCFMVFKNHWAQVSRILERQDSRTVDEVSAVRNYTDQMMYLLAEERPQDDTGIGPILELVIVEGILERLLSWNLRWQFSDDKKIEQLKLYELLVSQSHQQLLRHKPILMPLMRLLSACVEPSSPVVENNLVLLLNQICVSLAKEPSILELFFHSQTYQGPAKLLIFSILVPFIHRDGLIGQQARDALLLIMAISAENDTVGRYIAENSYFCPVLATGLSALYSSLPRKIEVRGDDWHALRREDWMGVSSLTMFMNSLEFCNAVIQVAHPLVQQQLVDYVHNGFLVPVMGPALHKTSIEEMIASTAYLDLFLRSITEVALLKTFLRFIVLHRHENITILDTLISRISSNSRLCMVSLSLFRTLLTLSCEDIMLQLVLRYLIPCNHVMLSQRRAVKDQDFYGKTADKFLSLIPECCKPENLSGMEREEEHAVWSKAHGSPSVDTSTVTAAVPKPSTPARIALFMRQQSTGSDAVNPPRSPGGTESPSCSPAHSSWDDVSELDSNYLEYLRDARRHIDRCVKACGKWSAPYDGQEPDPHMVQPILFDTNAINPHMDHFGAEHQRESLHHQNQTRLSPDIATKSDGLENGEWDVKYNKQNMILTPQSKKRSLQREAGPMNHELQLSTSSSSSSGRGGSELWVAVDQTDSKCASSMLNGSQEKHISAKLPGTSEHNESSLMVKKVRRDKPEGNHGDWKGNVAQKTLRDDASRLQGSGAVEVSLEHRVVPASKPEGSSISQQSLTDSESIDSLIDVLLDQAPAEANGQGLNVEKFTEELREMEAQMGRRCRTDERVRGGGDLQSEEEEEEAEEGEEDEETERHSIHHNNDWPGACGKLASVTAEPQIMVNLERAGQPQSQPFTGSFIAVLFAKLENMLQNSLYVNFLLTGIIAQLACYPQPLLRSFLLNTNMVFQPSVKSLIQVLGSVKSKIEMFAATQEDFPMMFYKARKYLIARGKLDWSESPNSVPPLRRSENLVKSRKPSLGELILRHTNSPTRARQAAQQALQHVREGQVLHALTGSSIFKSSAEKQNEALRVKNAVYCSLIFSEFLKELAAIAQEHTVTSPFLLDDKEE